MPPRLPRGLQGSDFSGGFPKRQLPTWKTSPRASRRLRLVVASGMQRPSRTCWPGWPFRSDPTTKPKPPTSDHRYSGGPRSRWWSRHVGNDPRARPPSPEWVAFRRSVFANRLERVFKKLSKAAAAKSFHRAAQDPFIPFGLERGLRGSRGCQEGSRGSDAGPPPRHKLTGG